MEFLTPHILTVVGHFFGQMRFIIIILTIWTSVAFGQGSNTATGCDKELDTLTNREIYNTFDTPATVIGGLSKLYSELGTIKLPRDPEIDQIKIFISIIVESNGDITDLRTVGKIKSTTLDKELLEVVRKYKWKPGTCNGKKVSTRLVLTVKS
jgi:hypothetical protein